MEHQINSEDAQAKQILSQLKEYAREHNLSNKQLAEKLGTPYSTIHKWWFFTEAKDARKPSKPHLDKIKEFLENKNTPEAYAKINVAMHRAEKIKYLLLLLEDELRWFRDNEPRAREEFRKGLDASDIGYISSLLTMLTEEEKFNRWLALTTTRFQSFKRR
jgi:hypothetical protein